MDLDGHTHRFHGYMLSIFNGLPWEDFDNSSGRSRGMDVLEGFRIPLDDPLGSPKELEGSSSSSSQSVFPRYTSRIQIACQGRLHNPQAMATVSSGYLNDDCRKVQDCSLTLGALTGAPCRARFPLGFRGVARAWRGRPCHWEPSNFLGLQGPECFKQFKAFKALGA